MRGLLLLFAVWTALPSWSADWSGRLSLAGVANSDGGHANQQGARWMVEEADEENHWSIHLRAQRYQRSGIASASTHSSAQFRYRTLSADLLNNAEGQSTTTMELDRLFYRRELEDLTLSIGRQPIDWGHGHLWQPLNLFGAFAPTDLDTAYKPGIDVAMVEWFPQPLSSVTLLLALAPEHGGEQNSTALHARHPLGEASELSWVLGDVIGYRMAGASIDSSYGDLGWRLEGRYSRAADGREGLFWIAGLQHQFENGVVLDLEWYDNDLGASHKAELAQVNSDELVTKGLQSVLSRNLLGMSLSDDLTPLLHGGYTFLLSDLGEGRSWLQQMDLTHSLSNESKLLFSLLLANGEELDGAMPQSEFGHWADSLTVRYQYYF